MKVNSIDKNSISFNGFYDCNALKKVLSFAEKNGALFASTTALVLSAARPVSIMMTPNTDRENKKIACAKAVTSTILDFVITFAISAPIVKAVGKINNNPQKYLKPETIEYLKNGAENLKDSKAYTLANQMFKLGIGIAIAAPKAILNLLGMPYILDLFFKKENKKSDLEKNSVTFKGKNSDKLSKLIGKTMDNKRVKDFSVKNADSNFPMHINAIKDAFTTGVFVAGLSKSKKLEDNRKTPLIYNSLIATTLSIISGYIIDASTKKSADKFIQKLTETNKSDPNLNKYIDGFRIAKPVLILGITYYLIIPVLSTFFADRIKINNHKP